MITNIQNNRYIKKLTKSNINHADIELYYWQYDKSGSFSSSLFNAIGCADLNNLSKLYLGFPEEVRAFYSYQNDLDYWTTLVTLMEENK